jgi:hypothetical protein
LYLPCAVVAVPANVPNLGPTGPTQPKGTPKMRKSLSLVTLLCGILIGVSSVQPASADPIGPCNVNDAPNADFNGRTVTVDLHTNVDCFGRTVSVG